MNVSKRLNVDGGLISDNPLTPVCVWETGLLVQAVQQARGCSEEEAMSLVYLYFLLFCAVYRTQLHMTDELRRNCSAVVIPSTLHQIWKLHSKQLSYNNEWEMYCNGRNFSRARLTVYDAPQDVRPRLQSVYLRETCALFCGEYGEDPPTELASEEMVASCTFSR